MGDCPRESPQRSVLGLGMRGGAPRGANSAMPDDSAAGAGCGQLIQGAAESERSTAPGVRLPARVDRDVHDLDRSVARHERGDGPVPHRVGEELSRRPDHCLPDLWRPARPRQLLEPLLPLLRMEAFTASSRRWEEDE